MAKVGKLCRVAVSASPSSALCRRDFLALAMVAMARLPDDMPMTVVAAPEGRCEMDHAVLRLSPPAGRGRNPSAAWIPGEGEPPRVQLSASPRRLPLTPTLSPQAGRGSRPPRRQQVRLCQRTHGSMRVAREATSCGANSCSHRSTQPIIACHEPGIALVRQNRCNVPEILQLSIGEAAR